MVLTWLEIKSKPGYESMGFLPDAAFLAREKARADAECYTAMKVAEANKVWSFPSAVLWSRVPHVGLYRNAQQKCLFIYFLFIGCLFCLTV